MARGLPTGVVTFLFTDVEGSTRLLHQLGDGYAGALHEHRRLLREAFGAHDGVEVDTQGDSFFVAFGRASDAVAAAVEAQRALADGPIKVRMGLHTGEPRLTDEGYVGMDVHKGARIAAVGHGGQILVSQATQMLVDAKVRDLGPHRLKDLTSPERIYQLEIDGLPSEFPLLKTLEAGMRNLPAPRTSFVGRSEELDSIERMLADPECRLLTVVGPGGVGKTRLALEAAARRADRYPHGVHFVPLVGVPAAQLLATAVAESLQFQVDTAHSLTPAEDQLLEYLHERTALLVLDNFEHLLDGRELLTRIVESAPAVEMLTTSRERLQVQSEWVLDLEGLELGNGSGGGHDGPALRLFVDRARQIDAGYVLTDEDRPHAEKVCRLVHGMPLGIELAAAWVPTLACSEIADEIERGLGFLESTMGDVPERHRSLRAAFDQSWRLLTDAERSVFSALSVFRGGFSREAAAAVADADLPTLHGLVAKSLVRRSGLGRFELHELLRQYASEHLAETTERVEVVSERHARHYLARLVERQDGLLGPGLAVARDELRPDVDNLRAAAEWAVTRWEGDDARAALQALYFFYFAHGQLEGSKVFERLADIQGFPAGQRDDLSKASDTALATLVHYASLGAYVGLEAEVVPLAEALRPLLEARGLEREVLAAVGALGVSASIRDDHDEATRLLEEGIGLATDLDDRFNRAAFASWLGWSRLLVDDLAGAQAGFDVMYADAKDLQQPLILGYALSKLGLLADAKRDYAGAMAMHLDAAERHGSIGHQGGLGYAYSRASMSAYCLGDHERALEYGIAGWEGFESANMRWGMGAALCRLGFAKAALGSFDEAREHFRRSLELARQMESMTLVLHAASGVGVLLSREGDRRRAVEIILASISHEAMPEAYRDVVQPTLAELEAELDPEELAAAREVAADADLDELVAEALGERVT